MVDKVLKKDCVGCKACGDICPKDAIKYKIDEEGFWFPHIDSEKCISCEMCEKVCPALEKHYSSSDSRKEPDTYKAYHIDKEIRYNSTSGALYYAIAENFLKGGGYIAGCIYSDDYHSARHCISNTAEGLKKIIRSKYFQSDTEGVYQEILKLLKNGEKVLFCGTPCQVSALYGITGDKYENLFSVDLICRGINSPLAFSKYMDELERKFHSGITDVRLKDKSHGWLSLGTRVCFKNGKKYYRNIFNDPWINAFVVGDLYMRQCCEACRYKGFPRCSDITIGDFWGINYTNEEKKLGVSVALVNTEKGDILLEGIKASLYTEKRELSEAINGNPALIRSAGTNPRRKEFFERIKTEPYSKVVWDILGISWTKRTYKNYRAKIIKAAKIILRRN